MDNDLKTPIIPSNNTSSEDKAMYSKKALVGDASYSKAEKAILSIVLNDEDKYTLDAVRNKINEFKEGI
ncbi:hypothetical protein FD06_GL000284 [Apilactobacillus ozensis DSM 23829 = JCM 17196]|uniref:Uncharacterized protein n=1 Tax=Apilactobacillus ozensis DSM 23829 = JCM 17196 TaxID=1423781 RepID=A0A0R2AZT8_9LACO|nr:hypothetical protein [Apilactobacillus ozensis]KRM69225.1 hypothetical protein FD06_GL000284 [Apilactobacillus ozensis DSM 23829 = JCM 17196]